MHCVEYFCREILLLLYRVVLERNVGLDMIGRVLAEQIAIVEQADSVPLLLEALHTTTRRRRINCKKGQFQTTLFFFLRSIQTSMTTSVSLSLTASERFSSTSSHLAKYLATWSIGLLLATSVYTIVS